MYRYKVYYGLMYPGKILGYISDTLFISSYLMMFNYFDEKYDEYLNHLLDNYEFTDFNGRVAKLNGYTVWVGNHPYASFTPYPNITQIRASRRTILKAYKKLKRECF